jgi:undecaprenyl diphosphate synthase
MDQGEIDRAKHRHATPRHVAIVMDGNGRWAEQRGKSRQAGHQAGAEAARLAVEESMRQGVEVLTLFAFSSENWRRPEQETSFLLDLFFRMLLQEAPKLKQEGVRLKVIGERGSLPEKLRARIDESESITADAARLILQIAFSYGGRWDITSAVRRLAARAARGEIQPDAIDEETVAGELSFPDLPDVDLFIRTGGELRLSNFVLWQAAYAELYFTDVLWPDFDAPAYRAALADFARRQRRFGRTGAQAVNSP